MEHRLRWEPERRQPGRERLRGGPLTVESEVGNAFEPLADAGQLEWRRAPAARPVRSTKTPAPTGGSGPAPRDRAVGEQADGAQQSSGGSIGDHASGWYSGTPALSCRRHGSASSDLRHLAEPVRSGATRARGAATLAMALLGVAASLLVPVTAAVSPDVVDARADRVPAGSTLTPALRASLQRRLDKLAAREDMPGVSVAILFPDGTTWLGTSGLADVRDKRPVTTDTAFALASVSKTFTSALIMALRDDGLIDLEDAGRPLPAGAPDRPADHGPSAPRPHERPARLLLRSAHRQGPADRLAVGRGTQSGRSDTSASRTSSPGKGWHYSNTNYLILGVLAERVGRRTLGEQLQERFFGPLGLSHTYDQVTERTDRSCRRTGIGSRRNALRRSTSPTGRT